MKTKVKPLTKRIMTLTELRKRTQKALKACRKQLERTPYSDGPSDSEFISEVIESLLTDIHQDVEMEKMLPSNHVAYCRYNGRTIVTCDADAAGAFPVYR